MPAKGEDPQLEALGAISAWMDAGADGLHPPDLTVEILSESIAKWGALNVAANLASLAMGLMSITALAMADPDYNPEVTPKDVLRMLGTAMAAELAEVQKGMP